jgi:hypothetical protein
MLLIFYNILNGPFNFSFERVLPHRTLSLIA